MRNVKIIHFRSPDSELSILVDRLEGIKECFLGSTEVPAERIEKYFELACRAWATKTVVTDFNLRLTVRVVAEPLWGADP